MKAKFLQKKESGSVLMITMVIIGVIGIALASYLSLAGAQNKSVVRSQTWNASIPIVEAGIEEAIVHLNKNCLGSDITQTVPNWVADGWTAVADGYELTRTNGTTWYKVIIVTTGSYTTNNPAIVSEGYVPAPLSSLAPQTMFAAIGIQSNQTVAASAYVGRKVRVTTGMDGIFVKGMLVKKGLDLHGNYIATDSFDPRDPAYSTNGRYDVNKRKSNGDIATNSKLFDSLNIGNADIRGKVSTGPGGLASIGANGTVGDLAWVAGGNKGIQPGRSSDDMNVAIRDVLVPFTSGYVTPTGGKITNTVIVPVGGNLTTLYYPTNTDGVITNTVVSISTNYPSSNAYVGSVATNRYAVITTNTAASSSTSFPTNYLGNITTNTTSVTTTSAPVVGTYVGAVTTNTVSTTTVSAPVVGTYVGAVTTNTTVTTTSGYTPPAAGTYTTISTNSTQVNNNSVQPASGTYVPGTLTVNGGGNRWSYYRIDGYTFIKINNYTYNRISSYTYNKINNYNYIAITGYTTNYITTGYTYDRIRDYSYPNPALVTNVVVKTYAYILTDGDYKLSTLSGSVLVLGKARLYVTDDINITGQDSIDIDPGHSLKLYSGAATATIAGKGVINNGGSAINFSYFGLPSNTKLNITGNGAFTGLIYAPSADMKLGGGGNDTYDFIGASVTKSATMDGHFNFHYPEDLAAIAGNSGYVIRSWNEIPLSQAH